MYEFMAMLLACLLAFPAQGQTASRSPQEQVIGISRGAAVEVRFLDKSKLRGRLGVVSDSGFELQTAQKGMIETRQIGFDRVKSVRDLKQKSFAHSLGMGFLIAGLVIVAIGVTFAILCRTQGCFG